MNSMRISSCKVDARSVRNLMALSGGNEIYVEVIHNTAPVASRIRSQYFYLLLSTPSVIPSTPARN